MNLYLLKFNNYYNRQVKKFDSIYDYDDFVVHIVEQEMNFNPGDGVNTTKILNYEGEIQPDYILVADGEEIVSRWFIIDSHFIRKGQSEYQLRRDVIADNYEDVINAPCFIEKATLDNDDPMIFNNEDMSFNQIKTSETLLKDESNTPWIVGYIPSDSFPEETTITSTFIDPGYVDIEVEDITQWPLYKYSNINTEKQELYVGNATMVYGYVFDHVHHYTGKGNYPDKYALAQVAIDNNGKIIEAKNTSMPGQNVDWNESNRSIKLATGKPELLYPMNYILTIQDGQTIDFGLPAIYTMKEGEKGSRFNGYLAALENITTGKMGAVNTAAEEGLGVFVSSDPYGDIFRNSNGKTILDKKTNTKYRIKVNSSTEPQRFLLSQNDIIMTAMNNAFPKTFRHDVQGNGTYVFTSNGSSVNAGMSFVEARGTSYTVALEQEEINIFTEVIGKQSRTHLVDAPYDMFCMPYKEGIEIIDGSKKIKNSAFASLNMAIEVAASTGSGNVYDIQLLPYCPLRNVITPEGINVSAVKKNPIMSSDRKTTYGYMLWCDVSNFTFDIPFEIKVDDPKLSNECDMYRLCSPSYGSAFEFSAAKNKGVSRFNVDATYKPFNPYIHVNPDFKGLYGNDFNDTRGLIVGGDFSLTQLSSAWANYELTNKNYQNAFDRGIENMNVNNAVQREMEKYGIAAGALQGAALGGAMGHSVGGMKGAAVGAIAGGISSAFFGMKDIELNEKLRNEALDYTKDMFGYQLGNIKAIPYALAKTSALTANNKLYPFLEFYTCSDEEKQALRDKIKYNGMTVGRIGRMVEYIKPEETYIKGKIIRLNECDDFHMANSIADEINKGVFI